MVLRSVRMEASSVAKKPLSCRFCDRHFRRLEHVQRHERTHTKETPFQCPCGRAFSRRDLLRRHEKSSHGGKSSGEIKASFNSPSRQTGSASVTQSLPRGCSSTITAQATADQVDLAGDGMSHDNLQRLGNGRGAVIFLEDSANGTFEMQNSSIKNPTGPIFDVDPHLQNSPHQCSSPSNDRAMNMADSRSLMDVDQHNINPASPEIDFTSIFGELDGYSAFLDMTDYSTLIADDFTIDPGSQFVPLATEETEELVRIPVESQSRIGSTVQTRHEPYTSISRFGSPLPSLQDEPGELQLRQQDNGDRQQILRPCWKMSGPQYHHVLSKIQEFSYVLPKEFVPLSRHTMSRYLEGSIKGLCDHLPFLHIPTFSVTNAAPELILSLAAIGAQFRFENHRAPMLFYAAKAVILEQVQLRERDQVRNFLSHSAIPNLGLESGSAPSPARPSLQDMPEGASSVGNNINSQGGQSTDLSVNPLLQTCQAIIALLVMGAWGPQQLVREAVSLQNLAATLARDDGFSGLQDHRASQEAKASTLGKAGWKDWILYESGKRTKLMIYCMLNLISVAYHIPPLILTSEINCHLPGSAGEWNANTQQEWEEARQSSKITEAPFQESFDSQFHIGQPHGVSIRLSPLANYTLILALLQHIFLRRQTSAGRKNSLDAEDIADISRALRCWQGRWERSPESSIDPNTVTGPVAFNSTALLRLAWIRLYADLGPCRYLASRDVSMIVSAFANCPPLDDGPGLVHPVLQAAHALSIPVRMGINYVSKTQTVSWSVQHSISNLECAIFLSKWLEQIAVALVVRPLEKEEQRIVEMIHGLLLETGLFGDDWIGDIAGRHNQKQKIRQLATAAARLWAEIFKGTHVFEVVNTIGASIAIYAESMASAYSPVNGG